MKVHSKQCDERDDTFVGSGLRLSFQVQLILNLASFFYSLITSVNLTAPGYAPGIYVYHAEVAQGSQARAFKL